MPSSHCSAEAWAGVEHLDLSATSLYSCQAAAFPHSLGTKRAGQIMLSTMFWLYSASVTSLAVPTPTLISQSLKGLCVSSSGSLLRYGNSWEAWETWKHETCILLTEWIIIMSWTSGLARAGSIGQGWKSFWKEHCHGCPRRTQSLISIHIGWQWKLEKLY